MNCFESTSSFQHKDFLVKTTGDLITKNYGGIIYSIAISFKSLSFQSLHTLLMSRTGKTAAKNFRSFSLFHLQYFIFVTGYSFERFISPLIAFLCYHLGTFENHGKSKFVSFLQILFLIIPLLLINFVYETSLDLLSFQDD